MYPVLSGEAKLTVLAKVSRTASCCFIQSTPKIGFIFFRASFHLICIYKVLANFWNFLNRLEKVLTSRDTCRTRRAPRRGLGVGFRDTWHTRMLSGGFSRLGSRDAWYSRTA